MLRTKESEHKTLAIAAMCDRNYDSTIRELRMAAVDTPAATTDREEDHQELADQLRRNRAEAHWLLMITQRLNGQFAEAEATCREFGVSFNAHSMFTLLADGLGDMILTRADENQDEETRHLILQQIDRA
jgi:hypothetical protein